MDTNHIVPEAQEATPQATNEVRQPTARERGIAEGYRMALRECAVGLKAALRAKGDPEFRALVTDAVLDWFEEAAASD